MTPSRISVTPSNAPEMPLTPPVRLLKNFLIDITNPVNEIVPIVLISLSRSSFFSLSVRSPITLPNSLNSAFAIFDTALKRAIKN